MGMTNSLGAYADVIAVLDTALRHDQWPVEFELPSRREAIHWRARANYIRFLLRRKEEATLGLAKGEGTSIYDILTMSLEDATIMIRKVEEGQGKLRIGGQAVKPVADTHVEEAASLLDDEDENLRRLQDGFDL